MGYAEELVRLLRPLGVYSFREGSFSLGELQALGGALDAAQARLSRMQRESIPATAEDEGLDRMEALFRYCAGLKDTQARRAAIAAFCSSAATALRCRRSTGACRHAAFSAAWRRRESRSMCGCGFRGRWASRPALRRCASSLRTFCRASSIFSTISATARGRKRKIRAAVGRPREHDMDAVDAVSRGRV